MSRKFSRKTGVVILLALLAIAGLAGVGLHRRQTTKTISTLASNGSYVALGDSVAAGVGLPTFSDASACNRTDQSYPHLLAAGKGYSLHNLACSGATLSAGILGSQTVNQLAEPTQLQQLFALPTPKLITLTIGANDVGWTSLISKCYSGQCGTAADTADVVAKLASVTTNLQAVLSQIQDHYKTAGGSPPLVIVTGYHQVFPTTEPVAGCSDLTGIDASERAWGRQQQASISSTLQAAAAEFSFTKFASIDFSGHELCTANPWVQGLADSTPYHPTAAGQAAFAASITKDLP